MPCGDDCSADAADVLVFIDQARLADGEEQPTVFGNRISLSMQRVDGQWLVDDISAY
jgi:Mce-associated membrane protein